MQEEAVGSQMLPESPDCDKLLDASLPNVHLTRIAFGSCQAPVIAGCDGAAFDHCGVDAKILVAKGGLKGGKGVGIKDASFRVYLGCVATGNAFIDAQTCAADADGSADPIEFCPRGGTLKPQVAAPAVWRQVLPHPRRQIGQQVGHRLPCDLGHLIGVGDGLLARQSLGGEDIHHLMFDQAALHIGAVFRALGVSNRTQAAMIARDVGVDPAKINYVAFRGGGEATAAILGGNVTVGGSGYSEFAEYISAGKMRAVGVTSGSRLKGVNVPTLKEQGINVEIGNWRGVYGAPGITAEQRKALIDALSKTFKHKAWQDAMEKNGWTPAWMAGDEFANFVDAEFASMRATMAKSGMI